MKQIHHSLILIILALLTGTSTASGYSFCVDGIYYNKSGSNAIVTYKDDVNYRTYSGKVNIPEIVSYNGVKYTVTGISNFAFLYCDSLTEISLPASISSIGQSAFWGCESITAINIPDNVSTIKAMAFHGCLKLSQVNIPKALTVINESVFAFCTSLTHIDIPDNITAIKEGAFLNSGITSVIIPNSVEVIENEAFRQCWMLADVTIGNSVKTIGHYAFIQCEGLSRVKCLPAIPPTLADEECFDRRHYTDVTLEVPSDVVDSYRQAPIWNKFTTIQSINEQPADTNGDGEVNISDINRVIQMIVKGTYETTGDVNGDGEINISDINAIIDSILHDR